MWYCHLGHAATIRRQSSFDPNALYQKQVQAAQSSITSGGGSGSPPGNGGSSGAGNDNLLNVSWTALKRYYTSCHSVIILV